MQHYINRDNNIPLLDSDHAIVPALTNNGSNGKSNSSRQRNRHSKLILISEKIKNRMYLLFILFIGYLLVVFFVL